MLVTRIGALTLAVAVSAAPLLAQQTATPDSVEQARQRARQAAQEAREAADRAREAAREAARQEREAQQQRGGDRSGGRGARGGPEVTENFTRTIRLGRTGTFELTNVSGNVVVSGGSGDDVKIDAVKRVRQQPGQDPQAALQEIQIQVVERTNQVEVRTQYPQQQRRNGSGRVDYTVVVPAGATVALNNVSGDIRVSNVQGVLRVGTVSGDLGLTSVGKLMSARTVSGDVQAVDAGGQDITFGTVSGDITLKNIKAHAIDAELVSGDMHLTNGDVERLSARSISGTLEYAGRLARNGRYQMQTQSGNIRIAPADETGFDLEASSFSGNIQSDYTFRNNAAVEAGGRRGPRSRSLRGTIGDASAVITLRSFSGNVSIMRPAAR